MLLEDVEALPLSQLATVGASKGPKNQSRVYNLEELKGLVNYAWERGTTFNNITHAAP